MLEFIYWVVLVYVAQIVIACFFNASNDTRIARNFKDFVKLTFLPYIIIKRKDIKDA